VSPWWPRTCSSKPFPPLARRKRGKYRRTEMFSLTSHEKLTNMLNLLIDMHEKLMNMLNLVIDVLGLPVDVFNLLIHMLVIYSGMHMQSCHILTLARPAEEGKKILTTLAEAVVARVFKARFLYLINGQ